MPKFPANAFSNVTCANCGQSLAPDDDVDLQLMMGVAELGETSMVLSCVSCKRDTEVNPAALLAGKRSRGKKAGFMLRCSELGCTGYVAKIEGHVWMCSECGQSWKTLTRLEKSITLMIASRPYRARAYSQDNGHWTPSLNEPTNYERMVERELAPQKPRQSKRKR